MEEHATELVSSASVEDLIILMLARMPDTGTWAAMLVAPKATPAKMAFLERVVEARFSRAPCKTTCNARLWMLETVLEPPATAKGFEFFERG